MKIETEQELRDYLSSENTDLEVLMNQLSSFIYINGYMCHMNIWRGKRGWTICWDSNDKKEGTPNITTKNYDLKSAVIKALNYLLEYNFHHLQNKDRNIFLDMITQKN